VGDLISRIPICQIISLEFQNECTSAPTTDDVELKFSENYALQYMVKNLTN